MPYIEQWKQIKLLGSEKINAFLYHYTLLPLKVAEICKIDDWKLIMEVVIIKYILLYFMVFKFQWRQEKFRETLLGQVKNN